MMKNKIRTFASFLGITLMVILMTCVFVGSDTVMEMMKATAVAQNGKWHINVYDADETFYRELMNLDYFKKTAVSFTRGISPLDNPENPDKPYIQVKAYSEDSFDMMNITLTEGSVPSEKNEAVVTEEFSRLYGIKTGDTVSASYCRRMLRGISKHTFFPFDGIKLESGEVIETGADFGVYRSADGFEQYDEMTGESGEFKVTGIIETPNFEKGKPYYTVITYTDYDEASKGKFNISLTVNDTDNIRLRFRDSFIYEDIIQKNSELQTEFNDLVLIFSSMSSSDSFNLLVRIITIFFTVLIAAASVILIYNVFSISYEERNQYLGFLSSVGATSSQKRSSVYFEISVLLAFALPAGILCGFGVIYAGISAIRPYLSVLMSMSFYSKIDFTAFALKITPQNTGAVILLSAATAYISAVLPAFKAGRASVITSLRGNEKRTEGKRFRTDRRAFEKGNAARLLASNGLKFHSKKSWSTVRALSVFMIILMVTSYGADSVTRLAAVKLSDGEEFKFNHTGDYILDTGNLDAGKFKKEIAGDYGTEITDEYGVSWMLVSENIEYSSEYRDAYKKIAELYMAEERFEEIRDLIFDNPDVNLFCVSDEVFRKLAEKCGASLDMDSAEVPAIVFQNTELSTDLIGFNGNRPSRYWYTELRESTALNKGDVFSLDMRYEIPINEHEYGTGHEEIMFRTAGFADKKILDGIAEFHGENIWIISPLEKLRGMTDKNMISDCLEIKVTDATSPMALKLAYDDVYRGEEFTVYPLESYDDYARENLKNAIKMLVNIMAYSFMVLVSLVCLLNIFNSVKSRASSRRREIAMLRSAGMDSSQINKMISSENVKLFTGALITAALLSSGLMFYLFAFLTDTFGNARLPVSPVYAVLSFVIPLISLCILSAWCYRYKENSSILENIRNEMV